MQITFISSSCGKCFSVCGDLIDGKPYFFDNQEFKCQLDTDTCTNAAGVRAITWYRAGFMGVDPKNEYHYIKKVAWSNDTFLIMTAWDFFALDVCDGYLTKAVPTCTSSQLYKSIPGPTNGTCYLVPQPMCSDNVITSVGQKSGCSNHAYLTVEAATGATKQLWKFTADSISKFCKAKFILKILRYICLHLASWSPRFPACASCKF